MRSVALSYINLFLTVQNYKSHSYLEGSTKISYKSALTLKDFNQELQLSVKRALTFLADFNKHLRNIYCKVTFIQAKSLGAFFNLFFKARIILITVSDKKCEKERYEEILLIKYKIPEKSWAKRV